jgi:murein L,D-transpeptidase YcbB/YkuD
MPAAWWLGLVVLVGAGGVAPVPANADEAQELLRNRIETAGVPPRIVVAGELIHCSAELPRFYERRLFRPAWSDARAPLPPAPRLLAALRLAVREGLDPGVYHLKRLEAQLSGWHARPLPLVASASSRVDLDLLLTDAFLLYASHLLSGRVDPRTFDPTWHVAASSEVDLVGLVEQTVPSGAVESAFEGLIPAHPGYGRLREAFSRYRRIEREGGRVRGPPS